MCGMCGAYVKCLRVDMYHEQHQYMYTVATYPHLCNFEDTIKQ